MNDKTFLAVYFQMSHYDFTFEKETYGKINDFEADFYNWIDSIKDNEKGVHNEKS